MNKFIKDLFKKKYKWKCLICNDIIVFSIQPYCKSCCHIEKRDVKMVKIND